MLWTSNILELVIELGLYAALIKVSWSFSKFLSSYDKTYGTNTEEYKIVKQGRKVFLIVTITIVLLMLTDSLYSVTVPILWLSDVYAEDTVIVHLFSSATTLFYATNTFFACLMLYIIYYFQLDMQTQEKEGKNAKNSQESSDIDYVNGIHKTEDLSYHMHMSKYLRDNDSSRMSTDDLAADQFLTTSMGT